MRNCGPASFKVGPYSEGLLLCVNEARRARNTRDFGSHHGFPRGGLVTHNVYRLWPGADEHNSVVIAHLHKGRVLGEKAVAGVDGTRIVRERRCEEVGNVEVALQQAFKAG
jgi:hypothetical protein